MGTFQGKLLYSVAHERFYQFLWRPRPPCALTDDQINEISSNLKSYSKRYEEEDEKLLNKQDYEEAEERRLREESFEEWHRGALALMDAEREDRDRLRGYDLSVSDGVDTLVEVEEVIDINEETIF